MTATELRDLLQVLAEKAKPLRESGVQAFELDGLKVELRPLELDVIGASVSQTDKDPLSDPWTYGGKMPGFQRPLPEESQK